MKNYLPTNYLADRFILLKEDGKERQLCEGELATSVQNESRNLTSCADDRLLLFLWRNDT